MEIPNVDKLILFYDGGHEIIYVNRRHLFSVWDFHALVPCDNIDICECDEMLVCSSFFHVIGNDAKRIGVIYCTEIHENSH